MKRKEIMKKIVCDYLWILIYLYLICHGTHWRANKKKPLDMHLSCTLVELSWAVRYGRYWQVSLSKYLYINVYNLLIKFPRQYKYNDFWKYSIFFIYCFVISSFWLVSSRRDVTRVIDDVPRPSLRAPFPRCAGATATADNKLWNCPL